MCKDKPGALEIRMQTRPAHLEYIANSGVRIRLGGPILDADENPIGSAIIIEVEDIAAARSFSENDPYAKAGVFESVEILPYRFVAGDLLS